MGLLKSERILIFFMIKNSGLKSSKMAMISPFGLNSDLKPEKKVHMMIILLKSLIYFLVKF